MDLLVFIIGLMCCVLGMIAFISEVVYALRIVRATRGRHGGLTTTDTWLNTRQFEKWRKLRALAHSDTDEVLRVNARAALRL